MGKKTKKRPIFCLRKEKRRGGALLPPPGSTLVNGEEKLPPWRRSSATFPSDGGTKGEWKGEKGLQKKTYKIRGRIGTKLKIGKIPENVWGGGGTYFG